MAIAGEGGVASSKPVATAVVGPGGLAIARPIATAIAGISPSEVQGLGIPVGSHKTATRFQLNIPTANRYGLTSIANGLGLLVGPTFSHESRVPAKDISADDSHNGEIKMKDNQKQDESKPATSNEKASPNSDPGQNLLGTNQFQVNQRVPGPQNFQFQHPFPAQFQADRRYGPEMSSSQHVKQHPHSPDSILPAQYPFIPPVAPYRFNWDTAPIDSAQSYEPIPFMNNRGFNPAPVYPFVPPVNPYQFYQQFQRQY